MKTVLLIGSGGREHAMGWKLSRSKELSHLIVAPGNDGMPADWERWSADLARGRAEFDRLAARAKEARVAFCVVGPDNPLADGIVNVFEAAGIPCFGPRAEAARLEASKAFAKEVMLAAGVPTARAVVASSRAEARERIHALSRSPEWNAGFVVKFDGLALGKGVVVCPNPGAESAALQAIDGLPEGKFLIEELLTGEELSWMAFCDGENASLLEPARDHKRLLDGDQGPNTGGMGAFSPVPGVPSHWEDRVRKEIFLPVLAEMRKRGTPFRGLLYAGLMADFARDRFWVLEFNARFGDPETQVLLPRMNDDFLKWCEASARGELGRLGNRVPFSPESALCVVAAAEGYPEAPVKGDEIRIDSSLEFRDPPNSLANSLATPPVFFAGVKREGSRLLTSGGRVLAAVGTGPELKSAAEAAHRNLSRIEFRGMRFRRDIGGER